MMLLMKSHISLPYSDDSLAYTLGVSTTLNVIDQKRNSIDLQPGLNTIISVTPQYVNTSDDFNKLPYWSRKCKMPHETYGLDLVKNYTKMYFTEPFHGNIGEQRLKQDDWAQAPPSSADSWRCILMERRLWQ